MLKIPAILTKIIMINQGAIILNCSTVEFADRFVEVVAPMENMPDLNRLQPLLIQKQLGQVKCLFENIDKTKLHGLGDFTTPRISDVFVAKVRGQKS